MAELPLEQGHGSMPPASLCDLPDEVLGHCLAQGLHPADLAAASLASRRLLSVARQAPVRLRLHEPDHPSCGPAHSRRRLKGIWSSFPGAVGLDASGGPLEDGDVAELTGRLRGLTELTLSGCKKLTGGVTRSLFPAAAAPHSAQPSVRSVVMQRCFQLTAAALSDALLAGMRPGGSLAAVALSHLDLRLWPDAQLAAVLDEQSRRSRGEQSDGDGGGGREAAAQLLEQLSLAAGGSAAAGEGAQQRLAAPADAAVPRPLPPQLAALAAASPRGLRLLALHNCGGVTAGALHALARSCPGLEALFLGGSSLALQEAAVAQLGPTAAMAEAQDGPAAAGGSAAEGPGRREAAIELAPGRALPDEFAGLGGGISSTAAARRAAAAALNRLRFARWADPLVLAAAVELAAVAALLPRLQVVELSFSLPGLVPLLQALCEEERQGEATGWTQLCSELEPSGFSSRPAVQFWDFCQPESVHQALAWQRGSSSVAGAGAGGQPRPPPPPEAEPFLRAAANCSSGAKVTPLHVAADEGLCGMAQDLLRLGADVLARDRSGASPLFRACELGREAVVRVLLAAQSDITQRNSAGEAPLYIAALRGHEGVVRVLLEHCQATGVHWEDGALYGDGWNPLMAAAVGKRTAIAQLLLSVAGPAKAVGLVQATNRYGLTAVHIAARRGSYNLVHCLVEAGGGAEVAGIVDCNGKTAADVARRNGNTQVLELLQALAGAQQGAGSGAAGEERGRRGRRARKAAAAAAVATAAAGSLGSSAAPAPAAAAAPAAPVLSAAVPTTGSSPPAPAPPAACPPAAQQPAAGPRQWVGRRLGARKSEASLTALAGSG